MKKKWTGERLETFINDQTTIEHLHRYSIALSVVKGKKVLDIASGEGYGSNLLAQNAQMVKGVDIDVRTIENAQKKYVRENLEFTIGSTSSIPFMDSFFDVVVSFETIEHHDQHIEMMNEIKRVLKKDGILIISSPERLNYSDKRNFKNMFHVKELYENEFKELVNNYFVNSAFYFQKAIFSSILVPEHIPTDYCEFNGNFNSINSKRKIEPLYIIAIASDSLIPDIGISTFVDNFFIERKTEEVKLIYEKSWSYKVGKFILGPLSALKKIIK